MGCGVEGVRGGEVGLDVQLTFARLRERKAAMKVIVSLVCLIGLEFASGAKKRAAVGRWDKVDFN